MSDPFLEDLLNDTEIEIKAAYACRRESSSNGGVYVYSFNTGQTTQSVTKASLHQLNQHIDALMAQRDNLRKKLGKKAVVSRGVPCY